MATFRKRGNRWQVQVRRQGYPSITKSFLSKADGVAWAREKERSIDRSELPIDHRELKRITVGDLLRRYRDTITPKKRGQQSEGYRLRTLLAHPIAALSLKNVSTAAIAQYRDQRLEKVSSGSVRRELAILSHCFELAIRDYWAPLVANPCAKVPKPTPSKARTRRLEEGELETLTEGLQRCKNPLVLPAFKFALATAMRRGEVLSLKWEHVDLQARTAHLPITKNGEARTVPLSPAALEVLCLLENRSGLVFPISANALRLAWTRAVRRLGIQDLRWHDLRRECVSRLFEQGFSTQEAQLVSGHKDIRMLGVYTRLKAEDIARKLANSNINT